jgi:hypothetical protein
MVPSDFTNYFLAMAGVGGTLVGLIFVAISIMPDEALTGSASIEKQAIAASAFTALLNPLIVSLMALVPHMHIGITLLVMSLIGLISTFNAAVHLVRRPFRLISVFRKVSLILVGLVIYGYELYYSVQSLQTPDNESPLVNVAPILVIMYVLGVTRAWELLGIRRYRLHDLLMPSQKDHDRQQVTTQNNNL